MSFSFDIDGLDDVLGKMTALADPKAVRRIATKSARSGVNVARKAARANAKKFDDPETEANISKNTISKVRRLKDKSGVIASVGVRGGAGGGKKSSGKQPAPFFYFRYLEFGTSTQRATPWLRPAFEQSVQQMTKATADRLKKELDIELKKAGVR